jgi:glycosyltransferase involved in cell wall biosynthesis
LRRHQVDVIYDRAFHTTLITAPAARRAGVARVSVIVTDPEPDLRLCAGRFRRVKQLLLRRAYRTADRIVTVSDGVRQAAIAFYRLPPELVVTIHNPLDLERVQLLGAGPVPDWEPERFHVVSAGRLHAQKGYRHLLFAMHDLVHRRGLTRLLLHVLGQGPQLAELQGLRTKLDLTGHVRFEGFQPNPLPYFRRAQVYCLPSLYEGLPNALLEAIACGTPVLATDCPSGPREILDDGRLGRLVPPADALALTDAISDAVEHHDRWRELAAAARSSVVRRFSLPQALQLTEEVLREAHHKRDSIALPHPGADG